MSHLKYNSYPGFGEEVYKSAHYSTAVRVPPGETIQIAGQGGWDRATSKISSDLAEEIRQAYDNVNHAIVSAGGPGMSSVFKLVTYHAPMSDEALGIAIETVRKWFPDHRPIWTAIGVEKLAWPTMHIEIEAVAHLG